MEESARDEKKDRRARGGKGEVTLRVGKKGGGKGKGE